MFIPDPGSKRFPDPGSATASKSLSILSQNLFLSSRKYDPGCSSRIRILIFLPIPDPGSRGSKSHRIPDPDPQHWIFLANICSLQESSEPDIT